MLFRLILIVWQIFNLGHATNNKISFPGEEELTLGSSCSVSPSITGTCKYLADCQSLLNIDIESLPCAPTDAGFTACCPHQSVRIPPVKNSKISAPISYWKPINSQCGSPHSLPYFSGGTKTGESYPIYHWNETADQLRSEGFTVHVLSMYEDAIWNMTYTNGTFTKTVGYESFGAILGVGGKPAPTEMAFFMALIGIKTGDKSEWICDGVLLNQEWILTAAHCFLEPGVSPNVVRLGDYDWLLENEHRAYFVPIDRTFADVVIYPDFNVNERYHDIALIKISKPYPIFALNINPVCLPWDDESMLDIVGYNVTLSGWGSTQFSGAGNKKSNILQAVELNVFDTSVCDKSYSKLLDFRFKWPKGMQKDKILCAGWAEGGRDACKGDSGAPLTYLNSTSNRFTLAGIVSTGFGCGLAEYPGIYIPINNPTYLSWIKRVAFDGQ